MKRKFLCLLLALTMMLSMAATVSADEITSGDWTYKVSEGKAILCSYCGTAANVVVPAKIDGYAVSELGPGFFCAFGNAKKTMKTVTLSEGIERINTNAFANCTALEQAFIPGSVLSISNSAFEGCTSLSEVIFSEGLKSIGRYAFLNTNLSYVILPASVTAIDEDSLGYTGEWGDTEQIEAFGIFGYSNTAAEEYARNWHFSFYRLEDMTDTSGRCGDYSTWRFDASTGSLYIDSIGSEDGGCDTDPYYNSVQPWIVYADSIRRVVIGEGITHLGDNSFAYHYPNLTEVILPDSLRSIGNGCFRDCTGLTAIELPEDCAYLGGRAFQNTGLRSITLPSADDFYGANMAGYAFASCANLKNIYFEGNAWEIDEDSFANSTLNAWYPVDNSTWNWVITNSYSGKVTWNAYDPDLFMDVRVNSYCYEPIGWAVQKGITYGITDTEFSPDASCKRSQVVTFLWRAAGSPEPETTEHSFVDVKKGSFYEKAVLWAVENGITVGTDDAHFDPDLPCTRAQVVTFLWRAAGKPDASGEIPFTDVPAGKWYADPIRWAVENEITFGMTDTEFGTDGTCTRGQVVTFLYRVYN